MKGKYLITTDSWFIAPDGDQYRSAWGEVVIIEDNALGIKTNRNSTNWFARVGGNGKEIIIAGCQIHYAIKCETKPNVTPPIVEVEHEGELHHRVSSKTRIYIAQ